MPETPMLTPTTTEIFTPLIGQLFRESGMSNVLNNTVAEIEFRIKDIVRSTGLASAFAYKTLNAVYT